MFFLITGYAFAEDGYRLWLRYDRISNPEILSQYRKHIKEIVIQQSGPVLNSVHEELQKGLTGLTGRQIPHGKSVSSDGAIIAGTPDGSPLIRDLIKGIKIQELGDDGYVIKSATCNEHSVTFIVANTPAGVLYGAFHLLRLVQTQRSVDRLHISERPRIVKRVLNHWDNLDRSVEQGYAGKSIWK